MKTKVCTRCYLDKPLACFSTNKNKKDGYNYVCRDCQNIYVRQHYVENRQKYIDKSLKRKKEATAFLTTYKSNKKCTCCSESDSACLDFHHKNPSDKIDNICLMANKGCSLKTLMKEIEKCILLCSNCHRKFHAGHIVLIAPTGVEPV